MLRLPDHCMLFTGSETIGGPKILIGLAPGSSFKGYNVNDPGANTGPEALIIEKMDVRYPDGGRAVFHQVSPMKD